MRSVRPSVLVRRSILISIAAGTAALVIAGCASGSGGPRDGDAGTTPMTMDSGRPLVPDCGEGFAECPTGFVCAAVMGVPRCVADPDPPPPGDGTDCRPCDAPGECRMGVCVQPSPTGAVCEFDSECADDELCIAGRCTHDPRIPIPCASVAECPVGFECMGGECVCTETPDCPIGLECVEGACVPGPGGDGCVADTDCPSAYVCEGGRCRERTLCDIENPDLTGTWMMHSTLRLREALPGWLSDLLDALESPFRFLGGETTCIDFGLPMWVETAICDLVRPYVADFLPPWAPAVFRAMADLNEVLNTWDIEETMELEAGGVRDAYRGRHTWNRVTFMYRDRPLVGDPTTVYDWRFSPSEFNASAVCGQFNIERHSVRVSIGSVIAWLVDVLIYEASEHRWSGLREALDTVTMGFCDGLAAAARDIDYPGVESTVASVCSSFLSTVVDSAIREVIDATIGADPITLRGTSPIAGPNSLRPGVWDGTLLGSTFSGDFDAWR